MKICFLGDISVSGIHLLRWAKQLAQLGHEIHVISFETPPPPIHNIKVYHMTSRVPTKLKYITSIPAIKKIVKAINPDLVHAHHLTSYGFIAACLNFQPLMVSAWGSDVFISPQQNFLFNFFVRFAIKKANAVIIMSEHMRQIVTKLGAQNDKITVMPFGIDGALVEWSKSEDLIHKADQNLVIISTRWLEPVYNVRLLIQAMPYVIAENTSAKCIIVGKGSEAEKLKEMAAKLGVIRNVHFLGQLSHNELLLQMARATIYVTTSLSDGSSVSLHEAMATGLFPICTDIPANRDWITNEINGFLVPLDSPVLLAEKILKAHKNKKLLDTARQKNWEIVNKYAVLDRNILEVEKMYQKLISIYR